MTIVTNYGIHRTPDNIAYLHQAGGRSLNFIGLAEKSPFEVAPIKKLPCPHRINGAAPMPAKEHWAAFMELFPDPLVQEFLPIPRSLRDPVPFVSSAHVNDMLLFLLSKLSSPIHPIVKRFESYKISQLEVDMAITNVCPLVLTHVQTEHQAEVEAMCSIAKRSPRKLILVGDPIMVMRPPLASVDTNIEHYDEATLYSLPMENLGAVALRRWARGEQINSPWNRGE